MTILASHPKAPSIAARTAATRRARTLGVAASLAVHALLAFGLFGAAQGDLIATYEGAADLGEVTVTLVRPRYVTATPEADVADRQLTPLFARYDTGQPPIVLPDQTRPKGLSALFQRLAPGEPAPPAQARTETVAETRIPVPQANTTGNDDRDARARGEAGRSTGADAAKPGSTGGLWGAIQPCWRRMAKPGAMPVTLEVKLGADGKLAEAPKVLRALGVRSSEENRLQSEALAISALAACMPRAEGRFGQDTYRLEFLPVG